MNVLSKIIKWTSILLQNKIVIVGNSDLTRALNSIIFLVLLINQTFSTQSKVKWWIKTPSDLVNTANKANSRCRWNKCKIIWNRKDFSILLTVKNTNLHIPHLCKIISRFLKAWNTIISLKNKRIQKYLTNQNT